MLGASQALVQNSTSAPSMPYVEELAPLYELGAAPRRGEVIMIAGRSGSGKSSFALWLAQMWGLDTLYFSADMSARQASSKLAALLTQRTIAEVEAGMLTDDRDHYLEALERSRIKFSFKSPIRWDVVIEELNTWVTLHNRYPEVIVFDNLMDFENAESEYSEQMFVMQAVSDISRDTGATVLILHHASDKSWEADSRPFRPPSRKEVKGGLSEKPEMSLGVAVNNTTGDFHIAPIKNRMGFQDPTGNTFATLESDLSKNSYWSPRLRDYKIGNGG